LKPVLALIRTCPPQALGSMSAYAALVSEALGTVRAPVEWTVESCDAFGRREWGMWQQHAWRLVCMDRLFRRYPADLYHLLDGSMLAFMPRRLLARTVVTVHDLIPLLQLQGELAGRPSFAAAWLIRRAVDALRKAAGVTAVSAHTRRAFEKWTGRRDAVVIPHAVRPLSLGAACLDTLPQRFILHVGNNANYKNRAGVIRIFSRLSDISGLELIMAGPPPSIEIRRLMQDVARVRFLTDVSDAQLATLYGRATLFLFPSLYEGFGMPVAEAMAAGCPVVCSSEASLPEVAGDAALMSPATDERALAAHCRAVLTDADLRERLIKAGHRQAGAFTQERMGTALWAWYLGVFSLLPKELAHEITG